MNHSDTSLPYTATRCLGIVARSDVHLTDICRHRGTCARFISRNDTQAHTPIAQHLCTDEHIAYVGPVAVPVEH